jgi:hypothetical protein
MEPYYVPDKTDFNRLFDMICPGCGDAARVQGNAVHLWIVSHKSSDGETCSDSNRRILPERMRPADWRLTC